MRCGGQSGVDGLPRASIPAEARYSAPFTWLGSRLDAMGLHALRLAFAAASEPLERVESLVRRSSEPYLEATPERFFSITSAAPLPGRAKERSLGVLPGGAIVERRFDGRVEAWAKPYDEGPDGDDSLVVHHLEHRDVPPFANVIALHGFTMGHSTRDARVLLARRFYDLGFDVALPVLPHHGCRAPRRARFSGETLGSFDVRTLNEAVRRAVLELHGLTRWLERRSGAPVGIVGLSLGGYLSALCGSLFPNLAFIVPVAAPVCLASLPVRVLMQGRGPDDRSRARLLEGLRAAYRVHSPLALSLAVARRRALIVAARGDRVVPPEHPYRLWRHWGAPSLHWYSGGHVVPFGRHRIFSTIRDHLAPLLGMAPGAHGRASSSPLASAG